MKQSRALRKAETKRTMKPRPKVRPIIPQLAGKNRHRGLFEDVLAVLDCSPNPVPCRKFRHADIYRFSEHMKNDKCQQCVAFFRQTDKELKNDSAVDAMAKG
jgi:hypothetical protein